jgi:Protein of unknown function, DUF255
MNTHEQVDREERPDVDGAYMQFVTATSGSGGWPMSVWLTPGMTAYTATISSSLLSIVHACEVLYCGVVEQYSHPQAALNSSLQISF